MVSREEQYEYLTLCVCYVSGAVLSSWHVLVYSILTNNPMRKILHLLSPPPLKMSPRGRRGELTQYLLPSQWYPLSSCTVLRQYAGGGASGWTGSKHETSVKDLKKDDFFRSIILCRSRANWLHISAGGPDPRLFRQFSVSPGKWSLHLSLQVSGWSGDPAKPTVGNCIIPCDILPPSAYFVKQSSH